MKLCRCNKLTDSRTDPGMTSELSCDLARGDVPQDHGLVRAAGANLAVVIGTVEGANEKQEWLIHAGLKSYKELLCTSVSTIYS